MRWRMSRSGMEKLRGGNPRRHPPRTERQGPRSRTRILSARTLRSKVLRQVEQRENEGCKVKQGRGRRQRRECLLTSCHLWGHNWEICICFQGQHEATGKFLAEVLYWFIFSYTRMRRCVSWGSNREAKNNHWVCWSGPGNKWQPGPGWKSQRRKAVDGLCLHFNQHHWIIGEQSKWTPVQMQTVPSG